MLEPDKLSISQLCARMCPVSSVWSESLCCSCRLVTSLCVCDRSQINIVCLRHPGPWSHAPECVSVRMSRDAIEPLSRNRPYFSYLTCKCHSSLVKQWNLQSTSNSPYRVAASNFLLLLLLHRGKTDLCTDSYAGVGVPDVWSAS